MGNLVDGQRQEDYGDPVENMELIAEYWGVYLKNNCIKENSIVGRYLDVRGEDVALLMAHLKLGRLTKNPNHQDSLDDFNGYIEIARRCDGGTK